MSQMPSTFKNMALTLLAVAFLSGASLGYVYQLTKEPIHKAKQEKVISAIAKVVPAFNNDPDKERFALTTATGETLRCFPAKKDGVPVGVAIETFSKLGFGDQIRLIVGLLPDGTINNVEVVEHRETPGLGDKIEKKKSVFLKQFEGKNPSMFRVAITKDGGDIDGITAATYSSRAVCDAVQKAYQAFIDRKDKP